MAGNIAYTQKGRGSTLVLIHGFCENKSIWKPFENKLSADFHVLSIDLPGFGESELTNPKPTIDWLGEQVIKLLQFLNIPKATFVGHSLGGYVCLAIADNHPEFLNGIGLFHSTSFADSKEKKETRNKAISFIEKNGSNKFISSMFPNLFSESSSKKFKDEINALIKSALLTKQDTVISITKAMRDRPDRSHILKKIKSPFLFVIGKNDQAVPLKDSLEQITLPKNSQIYFYEEIGHMGMIEAEKETILAVQNFTQYCSFLSQ